MIRSRSKHVDASDDANVTTIQSEVVNTTTTQTPTRGDVPSETTRTTTSRELMNNYCDSCLYHDADTHDCVQTPNDPKNGTCDVCSRNAKLGRNPCGLETQPNHDCSEKTDCTYTTICPNGNGDSGTTPCGASLEYCLVACDEYCTYGCHGETPTTSVDYENYVRRHVASNPDPVAPLTYDEYVLWTKHVTT